MVAMDAFEIARPLAQRDHDAKFNETGCLRRVLADKSTGLLGDWYPFKCPGCGGEQRVSGLRVAAARAVRAD